MNEAFLVARLEQELSTHPPREAEVVQHLVELGYLPLFRVNALLPSQIARAKREFLDDLEQSALFPNQELAFHQKAGVEHFVLHFLRSATDIDEGITIQALPRQGEKNLLSRIIHYRLDLFGLWPHPVEMPYTHTTAIQLGEMGEYAKCNALQAFNLMADIEQLTRHLLSIHEEEQFIVTFQSLQVPRELQDKLQRRRNFRNQLLIDFGEKNEFFGHVSREVLKQNEKKIDYPFLHEESRKSFKRFILRLIQVHQWQDGFYDGVLDSKIGEVTLQGVLQSIEFYNEADKKDIKTHRVLTYLGNNFFMFNALFFLQEYMLEEAQENMSDRRSDEEKVWEQLSAQVRDADASSQQSFQANLEKLKSDIYAETNRPPQEKLGLLKRIYFGLKKIIKKAFRFVRKIFNWIKAHAEKAWNFLRKLFKGFFDQLATGLRVFIDGLKFMIGKKYVVTQENAQMIVSRFHLDGDVVSICYQASTPLIPQHMSQTQYQLGSLQFSMAVVGGVLKIVLHALILIAWPFILITIVKVFRNILLTYQSIEPAAEAETSLS